MNILSIETSCDETAAAIIKNGSQILSNIVVSQIDIHANYGGVIPEIAARSHLEAILPVINLAFKKAQIDWNQIDAIAVTHTPGLLGSLLIGSLTARILALLHKKPLYPTHHLKGHIYATWLNTNTNKQPKFPILSLIVSGGHTQLVYMQSHNHFEVIGASRDDAVGEVFDKIAKILGLPYPGGPAIAKLALNGNSHKYHFPYPKVDALDFSFSGPKTAVLRAIQKELNLPISTPSYQLAAKLSTQQVSDFAASFQENALSILAKKLHLAITKYPAKSIIVTGGVSANQELRNTLKDRLEKLGKNSNLPQIFFPEAQFSTDNAAMIGAAAYYSIQAGQSPIDPYDLDISPRSQIS